MYQSCNLRRSIFKQLKYFFGDVRRDKSVICHFSASGWRSAFGLVLGSDPCYPLQSLLSTDLLYLHRAVQFTDTSSIRSSPCLCVSLYPLSPSLSLSLSAEYRSAAAAATMGNSMNKEVQVILEVRGSSSILVKVS